VGFHAVRSNEKTTSTIYRVHRRGSAVNGSRQKPREPSRNKPFWPEGPAAGYRSLVSGEISSMSSCPAMTRLLSSRFQLMWTWSTNQWMIAQTQRPCRHIFDLCRVSDICCLFGMIPTGASNGLRLLVSVLVGLLSHGRILKTGAVRPIV